MTRMHKGLAVQTAHIPYLTDWIQRLAEAFDRNDLHYYLETKEDGDRQPHFYCQSRAWGALRGMLMVVYPEGHEGVREGRADLNVDPWVMTGARNCYSFLRRIAPHVENDAAIAGHLADLHRLWPVLHKESGGPYIQNAIRALDLVDAQAQIDKLPTLGGVV